MTGPAGPDPRDVVMAVIGLIAISVLAWAIGLEWPEAILVGLSAVALLGLRRLPTTNTDEGWPAAGGRRRRPRRTPGRDPTVVDAAGLRRPRVERPSLRRLRAVAAEPTGGSGTRPRPRRRRRRLPVGARRGGVRGRRRRLPAPRWISTAFTDGRHRRGDSWAHPRRAIRERGSPRSAAGAGGLPARAGGAGRGGHGGRRHADAAGDRPGRDPRRRPRAVRGRARAGQDAGRPQPGHDARAWSSGACSAHPDLLPADITGSVRVRPGRRALRVPARPGVHRAAAGRRDQPDRPQDAVGPAGGDGRTPGHGGGQQLRARPAVPRDGHLEPGGVRGHLPAAGGAARPLHGRLAVGYPDPAPRPTSCTADCAGAPRKRRSRPSSTPPRCGGCRPGWRPSPSIPTSSTTAWPWPPAPGAIPAVEVGASPRGSLALLLVSRARAVLAGRDFVLPEDVKTVAVSALAHRITLNPQTWATGMLAGDVVTTVLAQVPGPATVPRTVASSVANRT